MKGAFEFGFILLFSMPLVIFGINFVEIVMNYNQARYLQNYAITQIEHQNRYDSSVQNLIDDELQRCEDCLIEIENIHQRYRVTVTFPIEIPLIHYQASGKTSMMSQIIK